MTEAIIVALITAGASIACQVILSKSAKKKTDVFATGMALELDKYYVEDGIVYRCHIPSGNPVYNNLKDLVNIFVVLA